ncbi:MAG TPA: integrase core domain-containing protein [Edaphobacter sp.]
MAWPAASTFGNILSRAGLTSPQKKRKRITPMDLSQVRAICEAAMREYGMPARIRTGNGAPFAGTGLLWLSKLSLGWMKLGIVHKRIQAGRPQQNGRHERMHRTLKEDTTKPPASSLRAQQSRFDNFRYVFNNERPHEGPEQPSSASLYIPSSIPEFTCPKGLLLRRVNNSGDISWHKNRVFISEVFRFEELGVELITPGLYRVFFRDMEIGELNSEELRFRAARRVV